MTGTDFIIVIFGIAIAFLPACAAGRWSQRRMWNMHLSYEDRVRLLKH